MNLSLNAGMRVLGLGGVLFALGSMSAHADFNQSDWRFMKSIEPVSVSAGMEKFGAFSLDKEVFRSAKSDASDLRIIRDGAEEVPYEIVDIGRPEGAKQVRATMLNNAFIEGKEQSFVLDFGAGQGAHNFSLLDIGLENRNFRKHVTIAGSDSIGDWKVLERDAILYDYSLDIVARKTTLSYPLTTFRYLLITISAEGGAPLRVLGATGTFIKETGTEAMRKEVRYDAILSVVENNDARTTDIVLDREQNGIPAHKLALETPSKDFYRQVKVYTRSDENALWTPEVTDVIFNYSDPLFQGSNLTISMPETRSRFIKIVIINNDNKPITVSRAALFGRARTVVFPYQEKASYRVYYGNQFARAPQYDLAQILAHVKTDNQLAVFALGKESVNSAYREPEKQPPLFTERYPYALTALLVVLVVIMGGLIAKVLITNQTRK